MAAGQRGMTAWNILRDILALADLPPQGKLVLIAMNQFGKNGEDIYPAIETIAKLASLSPRQTRRHIKALRLKGYLKPQGKGRNNTIKYALSVPASRPLKVGPTGHPRPTNNLDKYLDNPLIRDSDSGFPSLPSQQAIQIDRFSTAPRHVRLSSEAFRERAAAAANRKR